MEWQQLEYFITVARLQHMTKAAEELSLSQPALSRSIANLEKELGASLFERKGRNVHLNRYGSLFLQRAQAAISEIEQGKQEILSLINPNTGVVSLSFLHLLGSEFVPALIRSFRSDYPDIQFELHQGIHHNLVTDISNGDCDFAITTPENVNDMLSWHLLGTAKLFLAVPASHKWAARKSIDLEEIREEPYIGLKDMCGLSATVSKLFNDINMLPKTIFQADELDTVAGLVSAGFGVSLLPYTSGLNSHPLTWLEITEPICEMSLGLVWKARKQPTPAADTFLSFIRNRYHHSSNEYGNPSVP